MESAQVCNLFNISYISLYILVKRSTEKQWELKNNSTYMVLLKIWESVRSLLVFIRVPYSVQGYLVLVDHGWSLLLLSVLLTFHLRNIIKLG